MRRAPKKRQVLKAASMEPTRVQSGLVCERGAVTNVAAILVAADTNPPTSARGVVIIKNLDAANTIYIGIAGVTTATGWPILPGEALTIFSGGRVYTGVIYAIAGVAGPSAVAILRY